MYTPAEFAPLSPASIKKLLKGHAVRVKHGSGLKLHLSKVQHKKHLSSKAKGKGYNLTFDPYQIQMHGEGLRGKLKKAGKSLASTLIHEGIPLVSSTLGGIAGSALGGLSANPLAVPAGEFAGSQLGQYGGQRLADYIGSQTGYGLMDVVKALAPHAKKALVHVGKEAGKALLSKGLAYAEQKALEHGVPHHAVHQSKQIAHQVAQGQPIEPHHAVMEVVEGTLKHHPHYYKVQEKMHQMFGHGLKKHHKKHVVHHKMHGGTALIDQPFTVRQAVDTTGKFIKNPAGTIGFGLKKAKKAPKKVKVGGTLLIDQPFTARQAVNTTGQFFKDPAGTIGFGLGGRHGHFGGALLNAGY